MYAYCSNNPVAQTDSEGTIGATIIGAITGGIIGGISSAVNGEGFMPGLIQGVIAGGIAGFAVDFAVYTLGAGTPLAIPVIISFLGGTAGSAVGDVIHSLFTGTKFDIQKTAGHACLTGTLNAVSFGIAGCLAWGSGCIGQSLKEIIATPNVGDIPSTILASQLGVIDTVVRPKIDDRIDNGRNQRNSSNMNSTCNMRGLRMVRMYA